MGGELLLVVLLMRCDPKGSASDVLLGLLFLVEEEEGGLMVADGEGGEGGMVGMVAAVGATSAARFLKSDFEVQAACSSFCSSRNFFIQQSIALANIFQLYHRHCCIFV